MYQEDFYAETSVDVLAYADSADGDVLDLADDFGVSTKIKSTPPVEDDEPEVELLDQSQESTTFEPVFSIPPKPAKPVVVGKVSKMDIARRIYAEEKAKGPIVRKDIIAKFINEAGCTPAGANTYYANINTK